AVSLNVFSQHENIIWIVLVSGVAIARASVEPSLLRRRPVKLWIGVIEWCTIVIASSLALCWIDILVQPRDNFYTVFGFLLLIFIVPSIVTSGIVYLLCRLFIRTN
ncbi:MAG: hypothetical protein ABI925_10945, partial [Verrucomicrobiota bacterium]